MIVHMCFAWACVWERAWEHTGEREEESKREYVSVCDSEVVRLVFGWDGERERVGVKDKDNEKVKKVSEENFALKSENKLEFPAEKRSTWRSETDVFLQLRSQISCVFQGDAFIEASVKDLIVTSFQISMKSSLPNWCCFNLTLHR